MKEVSWAVRALQAEMGFPDTIFAGKLFVRSGLGADCLPGIFAAV